MSNVRPDLPLARVAVLEPPPELISLQASRQVALVRTAAGDPAWLVTGYHDVRSLFADDRLGRSHPEPDRAARISRTAALGGPTGDHPEERSEHQRLRALFTPAFTPRRMSRIRDQLRTAVAGLLDDLEEAPRPADLHRALSVPLPVLATCALFGIPEADWARCVAWSVAAADLFDSETVAHCDSAAAALDELGSYMYQLIGEWRDRPGTGLIADLIAEGLDADEIVGLGAVLFAGHDITVARLDFGALLLMTNHDQRRALVDEPERWPGAVEEILRMSAPVDHGLPRYARVDIRIGAVTIRRGDAVLLAGPVANRDPDVFTDPHRFDARRSPNPHLSFGHGAGFCLGAAMARIELELGLEAVFTRFPHLQPAVPLTEIELRATHIMGGIAALPVRW